jgi:hypothetical protein
MFLFWLGAIPHMISQLTIGGDILGVFTLVFGVTVEFTAVYFLICWIVKLSLKQLHGHQANERMASYEGSGRVSGGEDV